MHIWNLKIWLLKCFVQKRVLWFLPPQYSSTLLDKLNCKKVHKEHEDASWYNLKKNSKQHPWLWIVRCTNQTFKMVANYRGCCIRLQKPYEWQCGWSFIMDGKELVITLDWMLFQLFWSIRHWMNYLSAIANYSYYIQIYTNFQNHYLKSTDYENDTVQN